MLREGPLQSYESTLIRRIALSTQEVRVFDLPEAPGGARWRGWFRKRPASAPTLGGESQCPETFVRLLEESYSPRGYRAVICCGVHLAPVLSVFPGWTDRLLDVPRLGHFSHLTHTRHGHPEEYSAFSDWGREKSLLQCANALIVGCALDAVRLRERGFSTDMILLPPTGWVPDDEDSDADNGPADIQPGRTTILALGTETRANVDGLRWFVAEVMPRLRRRVPGAVLRVVGEIAKHVPETEGVECVGRRDNLEGEYRRSTVVALPLLVGDGIRRRAVEVLVRGKTLVTTTVGASGLPLIPGTDAIVEDDPVAMADQLGDVLLHVELRENFERRARFRAHEGFDPLRTFGMLGRRLGLSRQVLQARAAARALANVPETTNG